MGLGKPGRLGVDQPTITVELGPAPDAYTHYSPLMIQLCRRLQVGALLMKAGFFSAPNGGRDAAIPYRRSLAGH